MESGKRYIDGELISLDDLYEKHKRFVHQQVNRHTFRASKHGMERGDLLSMAGAGFAKAYRRFDDTQGIKFITYAKPLISGEMQNGIRDFGRSITFQRSIKDLSGKIVNEGLRDTPIDEIAQKTGASISDVVEAVNYLYFTEERLDQTPSNHDEDKMERHELIGTEDDYSAFDLYRFFETLNPEEKKIVHLRIMNYSQRELGREMNITQVNASRKLKRIKEKYEQYQGVTG